MFSWLNKYLHVHLILLCLQCEHDYHYKNIVEYIFPSMENYIPHIKREQIETKNAKSGFRIRINER